MARICYNKTTHSDKETGFFPPAIGSSEVFSEKPGFWAGARC
jgi:hypothetical protein